jgi:hypothetical protein
VNLARAICGGKCESVNPTRLKIWLRGRDLNPRPSGYEPDELPGCSTPRFENNFDIDVVQSKKYPFDGSEVKQAIPFAFAAACAFVDP